MKSEIINELQMALKIAWSIESSTLWKENNPALGQCGVTALVVHDTLGGEILKTRFGDIWHFYNQIDGEMMDFTKSQFDTALNYENLPSSREEAFGDTNAEQYSYLSNAVKRQLKNG